jgi:transposase-like protein
MARHCTVCGSEFIGVINMKLSNGSPCSHVAREFGLSQDAVERHRRHLRKADPSAPQSETDRWLSRLETMFNDALVQGDLSAQLSATKQAVSVLKAREDNRAKTIGGSASDAGSQGLTIAAVDRIVHEAYLEEGRIPCPLCNVGHMLPEEIAERVPLLKVTTGKEFNA